MLNLEAESCDILFKICWCGDLLKDKDLFMLKCDGNLISTLQVVTAAVLLLSNINRGEKGQSSSKIKAWLVTGIFFILHLYQSYQNSNRFNIDVCQIRRLGGNTDEKAPNLINLIIVHRFTYLLLLRCFWISFDICWPILYILTGFVVEFDYCCYFSDTQLVLTRRIRADAENLK